MNHPHFELPQGESLGMGGGAASTKRTVLAFNRHFLPGFRAGGPIRTLVNMSEQLADDFVFRIVTQDRDAGDNAAYADIDSESWNEVRQTQVRYLPPRVVTLRVLLALIQEVAPDTIYLNSFFDPMFTRRILLLKWLGRLAGVPVVLAPRGEFSPGALGIKKMRKQAYLSLTRMIGFYRNLVWHASSEYEKADVLRSLPFVPESAIKIAMNIAPLVRAMENPTRIRQQCDSLRVCFLSRISPKKNLDYALSCLRNVKAEVTFTIFGPREDVRYWALCEEIIASLPNNVTVTYEGEIAHHQVGEVLAQHDLFFLPTRGENYGHVIHEALAAGLPVLISDTTPWGGVVARGVGWELSLDQTTAYARIIDEVAAWTPVEFEAVKRKAAVFATECAEDADVLMANKQLFIDATA